MSLVDLLWGLLVLVPISPGIAILISEFRSVRKAKKEEEEKVKETSDFKKSYEKSKRPTIYREEYETTKHLMEMFTAKREEAKTLVDVVFPSPQLTNNKFIDEIDEIDGKFFKVYNSLNLFFSFYPKEDERSKNIIKDEMEKLGSLYSRLVNIIAELSILVLDEDCDVNPDDVKEDIEKDTEDISKYAKNYKYSSEHRVKDILDELWDSKTSKDNTGTLKDSVGPQILRRNAFGYDIIPTPKKCKFCKYYHVFDGFKENMCLRWHSHPIPDMDACSEFEFDHGD